VKKERLIGMTVDHDSPGKLIGVFANYCSECQKDLPETYEGKECPFCKINLADSKQECVT
jgi:hypothetical protein